MEEAELTGTVLGRWSLTAPLFERISAAAGEHCTADHEQDRHVFHLHILRSKPPIAIAKEY